ncbi:hypothetical protein PoB_005762100 [Plakobranchus ocellatus]|uniref:Uncharacterized protein n=1 Tax=Plakobranchus ocellatus TaxID=259542 RepID=A0AAV4CEC9_9GAST|nr:hypothetical protein PoB_005762100 [Plakobranchus ocellatus]
MSTLPVSGSHACAGLYTRGVNPLSITIGVTAVIICGHYRFDAGLTTASPQESDLMFSGPPSGESVGGGARTRDRRVPADFRADSLATVPPTPEY